MQILLKDDCNSIEKDMNKHEQQMIDMCCPECGSDIKLYDTAKDGRSGRYKCPSCGRDTVWAVAKSMSMSDVLKKMKMHQSE